MPDTTQRKIESIRIVREYDTDPDLSWLGEYSVKRADKFSIDRAKLDGHLDRNSFPYFNAANVETQRQATRNYRRMERFNNSDLCCVGVRAVADVHTSLAGNPGSWLINRVRSGGLWGIESDSAESYFRSIARQELSGLKDALLALGFTEQEFNAASKDIALVPEVK